MGAREAVWVKRSCEHPPQLQHRWVGSPDQAVLCEASYVVHSSVLTLLRVNADPRSKTPSHEMATPYFRRQSQGAGYPQPLSAWLRIDGPHDPLPQIRPFAGTAPRSQTTGRHGAHGPSDGCEGLQGVGAPHTRQHEPHGASSLLRGPAAPEGC